MRTMRVSSSRTSVVVTLALAGSLLVTQQRPADAVVMTTTSGTITTDETWSSDVTVTGDITVTDGATVTIKPGVRVAIDPNISIVVDDGALLATGTNSDPIVFTTSADDGSGDPTNAERWKSLVFFGSPLRSRLNHVEVRWGGDDNQSSCAEEILSDTRSGMFEEGAVVFDDITPNVEVTNSHFSHLSQEAITNDTPISRSGHAFFRNNTFDNGPCGIAVKSGLFMDNEFIGMSRDVGVIRGDIEDPFLFWLNHTTSRAQFRGDPSHYRRSDIRFNFFEAEPYSGTGPIPAPLVDGSRSLASNYWGDHPVPPIGDGVVCLSEFHPWPHHPNISRYNDYPCHTSTGSYQYKRATGYDSGAYPALPFDVRGKWTSLETQGLLNWDQNYGDPVQTGTGNLIETRTDLAMPGQFALGDWTRTYNSTDEDSGLLLGPGWSTPLDIGVSTASTPGATVDVTVRLADGRRALFVNLANNSWARPPALFADLGWATDHYVLTFVDGRVWTFDSSGRVVLMDDWRGETTWVDWSDWVGDDEITVGSDAGYGLAISGVDGQINEVVPTSVKRPGSGGGSNL